MVDSEIVKEIINEVGNSTKSWGFSPIIGQAWMLLYFKGEKTQNELRKELSCSLSAVSQAMSVLENFGMIHITGKQGRKKIYSAEESFSKIKRNKMEAMLRFYINPMADLLSNRVDEVKSKETKAKVTELKNVYSNMGGFLKLMLKMPFGK